MNKAFFLTLSLAIATSLSAMGAGNVFKVDNPDSIERARGFCFLDDSGVADR